MAEAYTSDMYVSSARWKLRLIGSYHPLPCLSRDPPCNTFAIKEIRDYYIPNDKKLVFRYVTERKCNAFKILLFYYIKYLTLNLNILFLRRRNNITSITYLEDHYGCTVKSVLVGWQVGGNTLPLVENHRFGEKGK